MADSYFESSHSHCEAHSPCGSSPKTCKAAKKGLFSCASSGFKGLFPGGVLQIPDAVTEIDASENAISDLQLGYPLSAKLGALRKLDLSWNNLRNPEVIARALGPLPALEELDLTGNPCRPAVAAASMGVHSAGGGSSDLSGRCELLAALLVPGLLPEGWRMRRIEKKRSFPDASGLLQRSRTATDDAPLPSQMRRYRSQHLQAAPSEIAVESVAAAKSQLQALLTQNSSRLTGGLVDLRTVEEWHPRHAVMLTRNVPRGCCLPRAHLLQVPLADVDAAASSEKRCRLRASDARHPPGAGVMGHFPQLLVLDGSAITVQDLEEAVLMAGGLLKENLEGLASSGCRSEARAARRPQSASAIRPYRLHKEKYDGADGCLRRVHNEFAKYRQALAKEAARSTTVYCADFEEWRLKVKAGRGAEIEEPLRSWTQELSDSLPPTPQAAAQSPQRARLFGSPGRRHTCTSLGEPSPTTSAPHLLRHRRLSLFDIQGRGGDGVDSSSDSEVWALLQAAGEEDFVASCNDVTPKELNLVSAGFTPQPPARVASRPRTPVRHEMPNLRSLAVVYVAAATEDLPQAALRAEKYPEAATGLTMKGSQRLSLGLGSSGRTAAPASSGSRLLRRGALGRLLAKHREECQ
eukprot:TRINITY_DN30325_c0_g1_i4.p1 TRINITY_DN30325_c0_g1~~TRINITY_DN30325_c0_g1_i4.p1  ORF type:complete len:636 (+),score=91.26 TRINITY_DN30325_c0_g1_i4:85-1992(+)